MGISTRLFCSRLSAAAVEAPHLLDAALVACCRLRPSSPCADEQSTDLTLPRANARALQHRLAVALCEERPSGDALFSGNGRDTSSNKAERDSVLDPALGQAETALSHRPCQSIRAFVAKLLLFLRLVLLMGIPFGFSPLALAFSL